jgi:galactonate dehydratase
MKIVGASIYFVDLGVSASGSRRNPIVLELVTDDGVTGAGELGMAYGSGGRAAVAALAEAVETFVIGRDCFSTESIYDELVRTTFWGLGGGPVWFGAVSAVDEALWDIKGKILGRPVYDLLGGPCRDELRVYANGWSRLKVDAAEYGDAAADIVAKGFDALKFDPFKVGPNRVDEHPVRTVSKSMEKLSTARLAATREGVGDDVDIIVEFHGNLWPADAIRMGRIFEQFDPYFIEEPVDPFDAQAMRQVRDAVRTPVAAGERLYSKYHCKPFFEAGALQIVQPDLGLAGGLTEVKKIAAYAEAHQIYVQPHNCGGPVATAACVNLSLSIPNFLIQEMFPYWDDGRFNIVEEPLEHRIRAGRLARDSRPGLGVTLNHDFLDRYRVAEIGNS